MKTLHWEKCSVLLILTKEGLNTNQAKRKCLEIEVQYQILILETVNRFNFRGKALVSNLQLMLSLAKNT